MAQSDKNLADAGYALAEEIRDGLWRHVADLERKPAPACTELIDELGRRCPGFSDSEYQGSLADGPASRLGAHCLSSAHGPCRAPSDCALRVGAETRPWREGECLVFDDTVEHEAWNRSGEMRIVLLLDFLRPGKENSTPDGPPAEVQSFMGRHAAAK